MSIETARSKEHQGRLESAAADYVRADAPDEALRLLLLHQGDVRKQLREMEVLDRNLNWFTRLAEHYQVARTVVDRFELAQDGEVQPPSQDDVVSLLSNHLSRPENDQQLEVIKQMRRPLLMLIPLYLNEVGAFMRFVDSLYLPYGEGGIILDRSLIRRLREYPPYNAVVVGWEVAVVEGVREFISGMNPYVGQPLEANEAGLLSGQLPSWQKYCRERKLQLCNQMMYLMLQRVSFQTKIQQCIDDYEHPLSESVNRFIQSIRFSGVDEKGVTILDNPTRKSGELVLVGHCDRGRIFIHEYHPSHELSERAGVRLAVVIGSA